MVWSLHRSDTVVKSSSSVVGQTLLLWSLLWLRALSLPGPADGLTAPSDTALYHYTEEREQIKSPGPPSATQSAWLGNCCWLTAPLCVPLNHSHHQNPSSYPWTKQLRSTSPEREAQTNNKLQNVTWGTWRDGERDERVTRGRLGQRKGNRQLGQ